MGPMGNFLVVQQLGLHVFTTEGPGSIPGRGTKIPQAMQPAKKKDMGSMRQGNPWEEK